MTTSRAAARKRAKELNNDWRELVTSASAATSTSVVTAAALADYAEDVDSFPFWHAMFTTGTATTTNGGISRPIKRTGGNTAASLITVTRAYPVGIGLGDTFELSRYNPDLYHNSLIQAAEVLYHKGLYLAVRDETLVVDDILVNSDFESAYAGGAAPSWTNFGASVTVTAETTIVRHGSQSHKVVADAGAAGGSYQAPTINIHQVTQKGIRWACWVYATAGSIARLRLSFDGGTTFESTSYHSGEDRWELLSLTTSVPSTATSVRFYVDVAAGGTGYFDAGWGVLRPVYRYATPSTFVSGNILRIFQQEDELHPDGVYFALDDNNPPVSGRRLRLIGKNYLTRPTTEAGTFEVIADQLELLCFQALVFFYQALALPVSGGERDGYLQNAALWQQKADAMLEGVLPKSQTAHLPSAWSVERDGTTYNLVLSDDRG